MADQRTMKYKIGDIIKVPDEEDYGFIFMEDDRGYFWIHWFSDGEKTRERNGYRTIPAFIKVNK